MNAKILVLLGVAAVVTADRYDSPESYESSEAQYNFNWAVRDDSSDNDFGQKEARNGDDTQGSYYVHLPDGRLQTVTYYVDGDDGYVAEVKYDGQARYPDSFESREAPRYSAPSRPRPSAPSRPRPSAPVRSAPIRRVFSRNSDESFERFNFNSFENSREDHSFPRRFQSREDSHEFFAIPKNPFLRDSNESF